MLRRILPSAVLALIVLALAPGAQARTQKPPLHGAHWVAITGKPLGATAGALVFARGGNAVDAACAMIAATATMWDTLSWGGETQALIWGDLVPQMIISAKVPRWWNVSAEQMHWAALHVRFGRSLVAEAVWDPALRKDVLESLRRQAPPRRTRLVEAHCANGDVTGALDEVTPAEFYALAAELSSKFPNHVLSSEIRRMSQSNPAAMNHEMISRVFGTPKPTLANSYRPELLRLRTFPTLMGYSSRIMAESWESNALFWATIADEAYLRPSQLNLLVPEWTQKVVERIFASHLEDWPALLRSLRQVGESVRDSSRKAGTPAGAGL